VEIVDKTKGLKKMKCWKKLVGSAAMFVLLSGLLTGCGESEEIGNADVQTEVSVVETFEKTTVTDPYEEWIMHTYYKLSDGTWSVEIVDNETEDVETLSYQYRIVLHDTMPNAEVASNYIILSNRNDITFHEAFMASGLSSNMDDYFTRNEAIFVSSWVGPLEENHPQKDPDTIYILDDENEWGIELQVTDISPKGLTIECTQSGGNPSDELQTGSYYIVEKKTEGGWEAVPYLLDNVGWTEEAWMIPMKGTVSWNIDWEWLYGELPGGDYRIGKEIMDFRETGDYDTQMYYVEFGI